MGEHSRSTCSSQQREGCVGKVQENPATSSVCPQILISSPQQGMPLLVYLPGRHISTQGPVWGTGHIDIGTLFLPCSKTAGSQKSGGVPYGLCHPHQQFRRWGRARQVVWWQLPRHGLPMCQLMVGPIGMPLLGPLANPLWWPFISIAIPG